METKQNEKEKELTPDELIKKTIKGDEEYYGQEDIIWRSVRGVGEMFRHLNNPHFGSIWTFGAAYLLAVFFVFQSVLSFILLYEFFTNLTSDNLAQIPIILFVLGQALLFFVVGIKIFLGLIRFLKKKKVHQIIAFIVSLAIIMYFLFLLAEAFFRVIEWS